MMMMGSVSPKNQEASAETATPFAIALVVDGNGTSRRFVELALGRSGFGVESAQDAASAFEILRTQRVELIVCDTQLDDMTGMRFFHRLSQSNRLATIPFIFLSADGDSKTKVEALRAGVDDYMVKPCGVAELVARSDALVRRERQLRDQMRSRAFGLAGNLAVFPFRELVNVIEASRHHGVLSVITPTMMGQVHFAGGRMVHAVAGNLTGVEAFYALLQETVGHFEFTEGASDTPEATIRESALSFDAAWGQGEAPTSSVSGVPPPLELAEGPFTTRPPTPDHELLVEAARQLEVDFTLPLGQLVQRRCPIEPFARNTGSSRQMLPPAIVRASAAVPDRGLAIHVERALSDPFTLGELCIWTAAELADFTARQTEAPRLHIHVVADLSSGVAGMLPLAGAPTEKWVLGSLSPFGKTFGLTFFLRNALQLDVVLIDANSPSTLLSSLHRAPDIFFVCPNDGSLLQMSARARIELGHAIGELKPGMLIGVGRETLREQMETITTSIPNSGTPLREKFVLGDATDDFRRLLVDGIKLWSSPVA